MAAVADPGWAGDFTASFDMRARTDIYRAFDAGPFPFDAGIQAYPNPFLDLLAGHLHLRNFAHHHALQNGPVICRLANIDPVEKAVLGVKR